MKLYSDGQVVLYRERGRYRLTTDQQRGTMDRLMAAMEGTGGELAIRLRRIASLIEERESVGRGQLMMDLL